MHLLDSQATATELNCRSDFIFFTSFLSDVLLIYLKNDLRIIYPLPKSSIYLCFYIPLCLYQKLQRAYSERQKYNLHEQQTHRIKKPHITLTVRSTVGGTKGTNGRERQGSCLPVS